MQCNPQPPYPPNNLPAPPKSNKKLWIVLGSIAGVMIIMMGGCAASSQSDYAPRSADSAAPSGTASQTSSRDDATAGQTGGLTGTWSGTLQCSNGETLRSVQKVAGSGNPIYEYRARDGQREAELTSSGQMVRFVPPEGGVVTVVVNSLSATSDRISYTLRITGERTSGGTLDQNEASVTTDAKLSGAELEIEMTIRSNSVVSQPGIVVPDDESTGVCRGRLRKE